MKTNTYKSNRFLVLWIYLIAFALMAFTFQAQAAEETKTEKKAATEAKAEKKSDKKEDKKADAKTGAAKDEVVVIDTTMGKITVKLNREKAPISVENFLKYVDAKHYDGTVFHRVIKDFMIQGGGMTADMKEKDTKFPPIKNEANNGLFNKRGTISMARTNEVDSATSQFFINVVNNQMLDYVSPSRYGYAVFGEVTSGMDVVDKIRAVETTSKEGHGDVPVKPITIKSITKK